jgi:sugar phosphate isomerase/epimerase
VNNQLTLSTLACPEWSIETMVGACVANGIAGIDFRGVGETLDHSLLPAFTTEADATIALLKESALSVPCMCSSVMLMQPDEAKWKESIEEYLRYLAMADRFGSEFVRIFPGRTPASMTRDDAAVMARRHARQLAKVAGDYRAKPILETHDDWGAAAEVVKLLADCSPSNFPVIWDVRHTWAAGETPARAIATLGEHLAHVHVKDAVQIDGREEPALLGTGIVTVGEALKALAAANYSGWICSETEKRWRPITAPGPDISVPHFARFVRAI